jgi:hypothetical protein
MTRTPCGLTALALDEAFTIEDHRFDWSDVFVFGVGTGAARALYDRVRRGWNVERSVPGDPCAAPDDDLQNAIRQFRRERRLLSGDETARWLSLWRLQYEDLVRFVRRSLEPDPVRSEPTFAKPVSERLRRLLHCEAVLGGHLESWGRELARWAVVDLEQNHQAFDRPRAGGPGVDFEIVASALSECSELLGVDHGDLHRSAEEIAGAAEALALLRKSLGKTARVSEEVRAHLLDWTLFEVRFVRVTNVDIAHEIATALREGRYLEELAAMAGVSVESATTGLGSAPERWHRHLLGARDGTVVGPLPVGTAAAKDIAGENESEVILVDRRVSPSVEDPTIRKRAIDAIVDRELSIQVQLRVRWAPAMTAAD